MKGFRLYVLGLLAALTLAGCGGGGGSTAGETFVSGVAATGAPIANAKIYLRDSTMALNTPVFKNNTSVKTSATGAYRINVSGMVPPYFLKLTDATGTTHYSVSSGAGTINLNPLTSLVLANAAGVSDPGLAFNNIGGLGTPARITDLAIQNAVTNIQNIFQPLRSGFQIAASFNPVTSIFRADGIDPFDQLLDRLRITVNQAAGTILVAIRDGSGTYVNLFPAISIIAQSIPVPTVNTLLISLQPLVPGTTMTVTSGGKLRLVAIVSRNGEQLDWSIREGAVGGSIARFVVGLGDYTAEYTAPTVTTATTFHIVAALINGSRAETAVTVTP